MSSKTAISFKIDKDVRDRARKMAKSLHIPLSMVVNQKLREFADERRIEFYEPLTPNAKTARELKKIEADIQAGRNSSPAFSNANDALEWLHSK
jgi:antitoxin component of RelBE/YafQ-DinJ toxin-antitoxin module